MRELCLHLEEYCFGVLRAICPLLSNPHKLSSLLFFSIVGNIRKYTLFSGHPGPDWQAVSVNYTGQGQIQVQRSKVLIRSPCVW